MLRLVAAIALALVAAEAAADAVPVPTAVHPRRALTAGGYDHFLGQLAPSGQEIYFAGNANSTIEIFVQDLVRGSPRLLFDDSADTNQPRISPDGTQLLYISYQQDAGGDACIFDLRARRRRCLTEPGTAVLHVFWFPDGRSVGALVRTGLGADHQLRRLKANGRRGHQGELLLQRNMSAPAVSPDGRWLAYVPLERSDEGSVSGVLLRASRGLVLHRIADGHRVTFVPDHPGTSGFPAFSPDGFHLYFTQYLNDTNFDGVIDGDDNGVLFRTPFASSKDAPVSPSAAEQLTSGRSNCQYPAPAADRLVATCSRAGYLQVYSMPLTGLVPVDWDQERIEAEMRSSREPSEQLLLLSRLRSLETRPQRRMRIHQRLVLHHLALREYESADYFLSLVEQLPSNPPALVDWVAVMREVTGHRREEQRLGHGKLNETFVAAQRERLGRLDAYYDSEHPSIRRLARLFESEILLVLGEKATALGMFEAVDIDSEEDPTVVHLWARQAEVILRDLGDRQRWMDMHRKLAFHPALRRHERLAQALAFIRVLGRGRSPGEALSVTARERAKTPDGSELALLLDLERALARVNVIGEVAAEEELLDLWNAAPTFNQHRTVAMTIVDWAARSDWGRLLHTFGRKWLEDVPPDHPERKYAEALYAEVMLERAYVELQNGRVSTARELFLEITRATPSLEAHVGYLEASLAEGVSGEQLLEEYLARHVAEDPVVPFSEAYVLARRLSGAKTIEDHSAQVERARALLRPVAEALPQSPEVHHLYAYLAHRHFHRSGDREAAMVAHTRYHLALDLAADDPRRRATLLDELGLLQSALGNHRIALRHFAQRERLPFIDPADELSFRLAKARSLFHSADYPAAKEEAARAARLTREVAELARYRPVLLDRAALYHYAAGAHQMAVELYGELVAEVEGGSLAQRMKARLGLGAAALADAQAELARTTLEEARTLLDGSEPFRTDRMRDVGSHFNRDDYRPLVAGLLAQARRAEGDLPGSMAALLERRDLLRERHARYGSDAYLQELARVGHQLAESAYRLGRAEEARRYLEEGLVAADTWRSRTHTVIDEVSLALVRAAAELHLSGGVPVDDFRFDLTSRVRSTLRLITDRPNPRWADERYLFPIYLTLLEVH